MSDEITVGTTINAPLEKVWEYFNTPKHIVFWNNASDDWHTTKAENDLKQGGMFNVRMEAKDGSSGFDFVGRYDKIAEHHGIEYTMSDGRKVKIMFYTVDGKTKITETFDPEKINSDEKQRAGWQAIMDNFKRYVESH